MHILSTYILVYLRKMHFLPPNFAICAVELTRLTFCVHLLERFVNYCYSIPIVIATLPTYT